MNILKNLLGKNKKRDYPGSAKQVGFIVGTGRSGTTILAQVLNAHSKICVPPEMQFMVSIGNGDRLFDKFESGELKRYRARDFIALFDRCCPYYFEKFFDYRAHFRGLDYPQTDPAVILKEFYDDICYAQGKEVFIEQTPWQGQKLDILKELFPGMKVVHMVRDARDVAISYARTPWWSKNIDENIIRWEKEVSVIQDFGMRNPENFLELRYEDLVMDPERWLEKILQLFGLPLEKDMLDPANLIDYATMFKGEAKKIQSKDFNKWDEARKELFFKESIFAWKRNKKAHFSVLPEGAVKTLKALGYEV